jgi:asparagine synthase (glutamine-hydrolysing)
MWFEIDWHDFNASSDGFYLHYQGDSIIYSSCSDNSITSIEDLMSLERCQAIEVNNKTKQVSFARDYLGFYPLIYTTVDSKLFITDEINLAVNWLRQHNVNPSVSEQSLALYFTMGYIPQGRSLYVEIQTCRNASVYSWCGDKVTLKDYFSPIEVTDRVTLKELEDSIEQAISRIYSKHDEIDVWCSGGLDSAIIAQRFNSNGRQARLLTMGYSEEVLAEFGCGEIPFVKLMQDSLSSELGFVTLDHERYSSAYNQFVRQHVGPVIDPVVVPKYALAQGTRSVAITGEGGDPIYSGVKNNKLLFITQNAPHISVGEVYAKIHNRMFAYIEQFFRNGSELKYWVIEYMNNMVDRYPGDLTRKLFYLNTFEKQGGMIFPKNYYAGKTNGIETYHPLTSLDVYKTAFAIADHEKYQYPVGKLALINIYRDRLPSQIVDRKKSGTRLPLPLYMKAIDLPDKARQVLSETNMFNQGLLEDHTEVKENHLALKDYSLVTLANWIYYQNQSKPTKRATK